MHLVDLEIGHGARLAQTLVADAAGERELRQSEQTAIGGNALNAVLRREIAERFVGQFTLV